MCIATWNKIIGMNSHHLLVASNSEKVEQRGNANFILREI
jgi:hypothetical protein